MVDSRWFISAFERNSICQPDCKRDISSRDESRIVIRSVWKGHRSTDKGTADNRLMTLELLSTESLHLNDDIGAHHRKR